jgi:hypothetical protein
MRLLLATVVVLAILPVSEAADKHAWVEGTVASIDIMTIPVTPKRVRHRYTCVISDGAYAYTVEYDSPLKAAVHDPIKLAVEKETVIVLDSDGKSRSSRIEKRERIAQ